MSDDVLRELAELVLGGGGDQLISKMEPAQSDLAAHKDRKKRALTAGLSAIGATAGAAGLGYAAHKTGSAYKVARVGAKASKGKWFKEPMGRRAALGHAIKEEKLGAALVPLEVAGLGGEVMATKILHGDTKKKQPVAKAETENLLNNSKIPKSKGQLTRAVLTNPKVKSKGMEVTRKGAGQLKKLPDKIETRHQVEKQLKTRTRAESVGGHAALGAALAGAPHAITGRGGTKKHAAALGVGALAGAGYGALKPVTHPKTKGPSKKVEKRDDEIDVVWDAEISKADADKQQIFGWASVVEVNGEPIVDLQGDRISIDEMEKAGYEYVMKSRKGGDMHLRNDWSPIQKSEMIESFIVTPEKREAMGLPDSVPSGWWVGFKVQDPEVWSKVKSGERTGFSIHGHGRRT